MDPELTAMQNLARALSEMDAEAQKRVILWAAARFSVVIENSGNAAGKSSAPRDGAESKTAGATFADFAELFHAVDPKDHGGRALVASYWLSTQNDGEPFASQAANSLLKDIGYHVLNITDALSQCIREKPALVIQIRKSGNSRQARKLYKITDAGKRKVQSLIADSSQNSGG
ncbi:MULTISPECIES: hypothetical protein [unclassified Mesorhizobium]|uniref:hypothetical protein n=1 Tax=unclassified Mesorhizobium TaxID=325217 RepID=UPI0033388E95